MTPKILLLASFAVTLTGCPNVDRRAIWEAYQDAIAQPPKETLPDGVSHVETVSKNGDAVVIPYKKYTLENGLTVVLHEDRSDPLVHVDVTYHVGSGREEAGKSGFAHFFEHMMFQGSENVADEQHFALIAESGGTNNGTTNTDRTNYYETVPSNQLEKVLWLESDRMGYFLSAVTEEKFENQREVVKNERRQRYDNAPFGQRHDRLAEAMFPEGHPYSWITIGYLEDIDRATLNDLKKFFLRWYGPNNATLTIGGEFDEAEALSWVSKYFGSMPAGPTVEKPEVTPVTLEADRYTSFEDSVPIAALNMSWPTVHANHPDQAALDVLMDVMANGPTSILYKNLREPGLTVQFAGTHRCRELSCTFSLGGAANPARVQGLSTLESVIRESFEEFETRGVQDDDIERVKGRIVSSKIYSLESVSGKVRQLAAYETFRDSPNGIGDDIRRYEDVTKLDVMRVYNTYIKGKSAVVMSMVPEGQLSAIAKPDTWQPIARTIPPDDSTDEFVWELPVDDFDRSIVPPAGPNPTTKVPDVYRATLANGIPLLGALNDETPTTTVNLRLAVGQEHESLDKLGLARLTSIMMNEATESKSAEEISNRLAKMGSSYSWSSGDEYTTLNIRSLSKNLSETVELAATSLYEPSFSPEDFARAKSNLVQAIRLNGSEATQIASSTFARILYGENNSFAYDNSGTEETVTNITLEDVKEFYATYYSPRIATIVGVSNLGEDAITEALTPFTMWQGVDVPEPVTVEFPQVGATTIYFVNKPNAPQSAIRIGKRALPFDATGEFYRAGLMNYPLGGAFNSRVNLNLREDKGYTYGARSYFTGVEDRGLYVANASVVTGATAASITELVKEIGDFQTGGSTEEEVAFTKSSFGQRDALAYEAPSKKLNFLVRMVIYGLEPSFVDEQAEILESIGKAELDELAAKHLNIDEMVIVVVGDKAKVWDEVNALGYPVVELDAAGHTL